MSSRGVFGLENIRGRQREGTWVPLPSVWTQPYLDDAGYFAGGESGVPDVSRIDKIAYSTDTKSTLTSNISAPLRHMGSSSSPTAGYTMGGYNSSTTSRTSKIDKLTYATQTTSLVPGNFSDTSTYAGAGGGSTTAGYLLQGSSPMVSYVRKITYATETIELLPGRVPNPVGNNAKMGSTGNGNTFLYVIGGSDGSGSEVKKLTYSNDSVSNIPNMPQPGSLNRAQKPGCASSTEAAYIVGGSNPYNNRIDKITFSNDTCSYASMNSTVPVPAGRMQVAGTGLPSAGYFAGGTETSIVEKITYSTNSIARIPALDLTSGVSGATGFGAKGDNHPDPNAKRFVDDAGPGGYGVEFDGSGDRLDFTLTSAPNAGDFTLEYWVKQNTLSDWQTHFATTRGSGFNVGTDGSGDFVFFGDGGRRIEVIGAITTGEWQHWAFARDGIAQTLTGYINGVEVASIADANNYSPTTASIGNLVGENSEYTNGIISNLRFVVGTCLYKENFTPPTGPLEEVNNTVLLCCQSESDVTAVTVGNSMTASGDPQAVYSSTLPIDQPPTPTPTPEESPVLVPSPNDGYYGGGNIPGIGYYSKFDKLSYSTETTTSLPSAQASYPTNVYAQASTTSQTDGWSNKNSGLFKLTYSTSTQSNSPVTSLTFNPVGAASGFGYLPKGYIVGGYSGGPISTMNEITFATSTVGSAPNFAYAGYDRSSGTGNQTAGYLAGAIPGTTNAGKYVYATSTSVALPGKLSQARSESGATGNETNVYFSGCGSNSHGSRTDRVVYSSDTFTYIPGANLLKDLDGVAATSSSTAGYITGGSNPDAPNVGGTSSVSKLTFSNETMAWLPSSADTAQPRMHFMGFSARQYANGETMSVPTPNNF